jgi:hypothetical protein
MRILSFWECWDLLTILLEIGALYLLFFCFYSKKFHAIYTSFLFFSTLFLGNNYVALFGIFDASFFVTHYFYKKLNKWWLNIIYVAVPYFVNKFKYNILSVNSTNIDILLFDDKTSFIYKFTELFKLSLCIDTLLFFYFVIFVKFIQPKYTASDNKNSFVWVFYLVVLYYTFRFLQIIFGIFDIDFLLFLNEYF